MKKGGAKHVPMGGGGWGGVFGAVAAGAAYLLRGAQNSGDDSANVTPTWPTTGSERTRNSIREIYQLPGNRMHEAQTLTNLFTTNILEKVSEDEGKILQELQYEVYRFLRANVTAASYSGEGANDGGFIQIYFKIQMTRGPPRYMTVCVSKDLYEKDPNFYDPRPTESPQSDAVPEQLDLSIVVLLVGMFAGCLVMVTLLIVCWMKLPMKDEFEPASEMTPSPSEKRKERPDFD
ncbi:unnamed protein product, partial [Mesorhabditis spiculigera]